MTRHRLVLSALALTVTPCAGCASLPPSAIGATLASQRGAAERLSIAFAEDHALLRAQVEALIGVRRVALIGAIHRELLTRGYISPTLDSSPDALDRDLADAGANTTLTREVRAGAMTRDQAALWLADYSLTLRMSDGNEVREALLGRLAPVRTFSGAAEILPAALDARRDDMRALFFDLDTSGLALERFSMFRPAPGAGGMSAARESLGRLVIDRLPDPRKRAAALAALDLLFPASTPSALAPR